ncbi:MAG: hypothetical protein JO131_09705 [Gammaproteobacteria bacterium]|nr:hypothetical protein [Gammaproteobacteria bacterium]
MLSTIITIHHPGEVLKGLYIEPLKLTNEVAKGISVSRKSPSQLVNGKFGVSTDMAIGSIEF